MKHLVLSTVFFLFFCIQKSYNYNKMHHNLEKVDQYPYKSIPNDCLKVRIYTLKNGLTVYLSRNNYEPRIQTFIPVRVGSVNDPKNNTGLAHYLEHMLFKGTSKIGTSNWKQEKYLLNQISNLYEKHKNEYDPKIKMKIYQHIDKLSQSASKFSIPNEYDQLITSIGSKENNAYTWLDETVYMNNIPSNELEKWLRIEKERFSELVLRLFHTELETVYEEFNRSQDNDSRWISKQLMSALFPTHPYRQSTLGSAEHLKNPSMKAIHNFFNRYYIPNNMAIILVGDLNYDVTIKLIDNYFGTFKSKKYFKEIFPKQKKINSIIKKTTLSPSPESISLAFRSDTDNKEQLLKLELIDMILYNSKVGLIDLNLLKKQKSRQIISQISLHNQYAIHLFSGIPKENQTLEELEQLILSEIDNIKKGNFEEWMIEAVINNLELQRLKEQENIENLASHLVSIFIRNESYEEYLNKFNKMRIISKSDIIEFANEFYQDNYVVVYKKKGENKNLIKVKNPNITPIKINNHTHSKFFKEIINLPSTEIHPKFIDYNKEIKKNIIKKTPFYFIENTQNNSNISSIYYLFDQGVDHNKKLKLAFDYLKYLGTNTKTADDISKDFYRLGVDFNIQILDDRSIISISGLSKNLPKGIEIFEDLIKNIKPNEKLLKKLIHNLLKQRKDAKINKNSLARALDSYSIYGANNRFRKMISSSQLNEIQSKELIDIIKKMTDYKHRIFYFGKNNDTILKTLMNYHNFGTNIPQPLIEKFEPQIANNLIYLVHYDMVQLEMRFYKRNEIFKKENILKSMILNEYFGYGLSSIVFQEIRESKSLGYSAYFVVKKADSKGKFDHTHAYLGTQIDKFEKATTAMLNLTKKFPRLEDSFETAKKTIRKNLESSVIRGEEIFWNYENLKKLGIYKDIRKEIYENIQSITLNDLENYFNSTIKGIYNYSIIGDIKGIDLSILQKIGQVNILSADEIFTE